MKNNIKNEKKIKTMRKSIRHYIFCDCVVFILIIVGVNVIPGIVSSSVEYLSSGDMWQKVLFCGSFFLAIFVLNLIEGAIVPKTIFNILNDAVEPIYILLLLFIEYRRLRNKRNAITALRYSIVEKQRKDDFKMALANVSSRKKN